MVDDDEDMRIVLRLSLVLAGFATIAESHDGLQAIHDARVMKPNVVILDAQMPRLSGESAAPGIRQVSPGSSIIAFSAHLDGCPPWADGWMDKPSIDQLPDMIDGFVAAARD